MQIDPSHFNTGMNGAAHCAINPTAALAYPVVSQPTLGCKAHGMGHALKNFGFTLACSSAFYCAQLICV